MKETCENTPNLDVKQLLIDELMEERTGINTMTAEDPMTCVAIGTGKYVEFMAGNHDLSQP